MIAMNVSIIAREPKTHIAHISWEQSRAKRAHTHTHEQTQTTTNVKKR